LDYLQYTNVDGRIILKWMLKIWEGGVVWIDLVLQDRDRWRTYECGKEPSGSVKCREFLD